MRIKFLKTMPTLLVAVIVLLLLPGLACNLFSTQPDELEVIDDPIVIEEPVVIEEPEDESVFRPELVLRLDIEDTVNSVAYANDGDLIATGTFKQADIWQVDNGSLVQVFEAHHRVDGMAFLPGDDTILLSVTTRGTHTYDILSGEEILYFEDRGHDPRMALSSDGTLVASGNRSGETWLWRVSDGELIFEMDPANYVEGYSEYLTALAFSPDDRLVAAGHWDGTIFIWNVETGTLERLIEPETDRCAAWGLAFSNNGKILAVGGAALAAEIGFNEVVRLWQVSDGILMRDLEHGSRGGSMVSPVVFSPDDNLIAFGATDGIYIWSLSDDELLHTIPIEESGASDWVTDLAFSPDSQNLLAGYWDNYAILWLVQE